jgi:hypothetical protein
MQNRTSVSRYRPARGTDIRSRVARAPGQEPRSTRRGDSARLHSGRSWTFRSRLWDPGRTRMTGPAGPAGTVCSGGPVSPGGRGYDAPPSGAASGRADTTRPGPVTPGRRGARPDDRATLTHPRSSSSEPGGLPGITTLPPAHDGVAWAASGTPPPVPVTRPGAPDRGQRCRCLPVPGGTCHAHRPDPANEPPTDDQKARPPLGDQAPDLHFLVAGAGFEPATSGL